MRAVIAHKREQIICTPGLRTCARLRLRRERHEEDGEEEVRHLGVIYDYYICGHPNYYRTSRVSVNRP